MERSIGFIKIEYLNNSINSVEIISLRQFSQSNKKNTNSLILQYRLFSQYSIRTKKHTNQVVGSNYKN